jgi:membrane-associated phospholipid phosphatase
MHSAGAGTKRMRGLALVLLVVGLSAEAKEPQVLPDSAHGVFTGEEWRYRRANLFSGLLLRTAADLVAIPSGAPWWGAGDWLAVGGVLGSTVALSVGKPSFDVQFQGFVQNQLLGGPDHFRVWTTIGDIVIWSTAAAMTVSLMLYGIGSGNEAVTETAALMIEAFAVAQLYHQMIKLLVGRAAPSRPELEGQYFGPARSLELWPGGTPSGHMASMYALLTVVMYSVDHPALWVGLNAFMLVFGAALVGDNYHWVSDVILGGAIGFCVGRWVMQHRSTHFVYGEKRSTLKIGFSPIVLPGSGGGLAVVGSF